MNECTNNGLKIEKEIIEHINKNQYIEKMNDNIQKFLHEIFDFDLEEIKIKAYKFAENYKPDIIITANGVSKYISIKSGKNNSIHQEHFYSFIEYLKEFNISEETIVYIKEFQFNDGTLNGSGMKRYSANDFQAKYPKKIQEINKSLNNPIIKKALISRLLFRGEYYHIPCVDYIYHGSLKKGLWANKEDITKLLTNTNNYSSSIHISKLYYQSLHRNLKYDKYYEYRRYHIQFKWYSIIDDLEYIMKKKERE